MSEQKPAGVLIYGESLQITDEVAYVLVDDFLSSGSGDLPVGASDQRPSDHPERVDEQRRFGAIARVCTRLRNLPDREQRLSWLVRPNESLGGQRPVDAVSSGRVEDVVAEADRLT